MLLSKFCVLKYTRTTAFLHQYWRTRLNNIRIFAPIFLKYWFAILSNDTSYVSKPTIFNLIISIFNLIRSLSIEHGEQRAVRRSTSRRTADVQNSVPPARQPVADPGRGHRGHDEESAKDLRRHFWGHVDHKTRPT